jgi:hypothetical protein
VCIDWQQSRTDRSAKANCDSQQILFRAIEVMKSKCVRMDTKTTIYKAIIRRVLWYAVALGGLVVSVLATVPKVRGFDPDRGRWIFKGDKNPEHHSLRRGSKAVSPMS